MQEAIEQLKSLFRNFWEHHWLALLTAAIICLLGWTAVITTANRYEVTSRVYLDTRSMLVPILKGLAVDSAVTVSTAELMQRTMLARPNLEIVAKKAKIADKVESPEQFEKMINRLATKIDINGGRESNNVYTISYEHRDPVVAKKIVEALLDLFIDRVINANRLDTDVTRKFLDEQIAEYEGKLIAAEERLKVFKQEHLGAMPQDGRTYFSRLESLKNDLQTAKLDLQERIHRRNAIRSQLAGTAGSIGGSSGELPSAIDMKILEIQAQMEELVLKFTDYHPDVIAAKRMLEQLKKQKASGVGEGYSAGAASSAAINPVYHGLKVNLSEEQAKVAALTARVQEYTKRVQELESAVDTLPDVEAELTKLDRDYNTNKLQYEELLKRREAAKLSEGANNADELQFEVIEPPRVPLNPTGPNRLKWVTLIFAIALAAGLGIAIFLSQLRPKIYDRRSLKDLTTLPVLGCVSEVNRWDNHLAKGAGYISYSAAAGALFVMYISIAALYIMEVEFIQKLAGYSFVEKVEEQVDVDVIDPVKDILGEI